MVSVGDRKETSLRACIAHMLNIDFSEVPTKREANIGQWLALRNLGSYQSPLQRASSGGHFLGLKRDSSTLAVFFGAKELGIFGAPSFVVGAELFWGNDRLQDALAWAGSRTGEARR